MRTFLICFLLGLLPVGAHAQTVRRATPVTAPVPAQPSPQEVFFRPGEIFELRMTGMPAEDALPYAQQFTIGGNGLINIPLGGPLKAASLTQSQLENAIVKLLLDKKIFTRATATISVAAQSRVVTVGGQVRAPQRMMWTMDLTLNSAISAAGGTADFASNKIKLTRGGTVTFFSKKDLEKNPAQDPRLLPGDRVDQL